ncbi:MAG TPA: hypothetical protein VFW49_06175 [Fluviicoccus sp.]|nr:hypothetical protein [Fluviicoccus sp.]
MSTLHRLLKSFSHDTRLFLLALAAGDCPESWRSSADEKPD